MGGDSQMKLPEVKGGIYSKDTMEPCLSVASQIPGSYEVQALLLL